MQSLTLCIEESRAYYKGISAGLDNQWLPRIERQWRNLLSQIRSSLRRLTILAPPYCLRLLLSVKFDPDICKILHMPYHLLVLKRPGPSITVGMCDLDGMGQFTQSFCQNIQSFECITIFAHHNHTVTWLTMLKSVINLLRFQTTRIQDLELDP